MGAKPQKLLRDSYVLHHYREQMKLYPLENDSESNPILIYLDPL